MNFSRWEVVQPPPKHWSLDLTSLHGALPFYADRLLYNRDIRTVSAAREYIGDAGGTLFAPSVLPGIDQATKLVVKHLTAGNTIGIYGDFDADGITATAILGNLLKQLGAETCFHIPDREKDGHGINQNGIDALLNHGARLIITVDTGISADAETRYAQARGAEVIITDHHALTGALPPAEAIVNHHLLNGGNSQGFGLSGAGTAFKLAQAICDRVDQQLPDGLLALAAIGTIADRVPLKGENRTLSKLGLEELATTAHWGLRALLEKAVPPRPGLKNCSTETIAYYVAPTINAPGRLGTATDALQLLLTRDKATAHDLAARLVKVNQRRKKLSKAAIAAVKDQVDQQSRRAVFALDASDYPLGIMGPLASHFSELYARPVVAYKKHAGSVRASARGAGGFDLHDAIATAGVELERFGGHANAAGFTIASDSFSKLWEALESKAQWMQIKGTKTQGKVLAIDCEADLSLFTQGDWEFVRRMEPFGEANRAPLFVSRRVQPAQVRTIGATGNHLRMEVIQHGRSLPAVGFYMGNRDLGSKTIDIVFKLKTDSWHGTARRELQLVDLKVAQ